MENFIYEINVVRGSYVPITFHADKKPKFAIGKLRNRKDCKHLRYFRNVYCVVTNYDKNKDTLDQRVFSSLFLFAPPRKKRKRLLRTQNKLENHEGLPPSLPARKKIFPNVHGLLSFKDVIS